MLHLPEPLVFPERSIVGELPDLRRRGRGAALVALDLRYSPVRHQAPDVVPHAIDADAVAVVAALAEGHPLRLPDVLEAERAMKRFLRRGGSDRIPHPRRRPLDEQDALGRQLERLHPRHGRGEEHGPVPRYGLGQAHSGRPRQQVRPACCHWGRRGLRYRRHDASDALLLEEREALVLRPQRRHRGGKPRPSTSLHDGRRVRLHRCKMSRHRA
mmetsp:Transcript_6012/g.17382  ORF Transcript_6012/g.17382 Transcript_6012/m.17382 type:complete len:214 (-) Transcript_6012:2-643(-)